MAQLQQHQEQQHGENKEMREQLQLGERQGPGESEAR